METPRGVLVILAISVSVLLPALPILAGPPDPGGHAHSRYVRAVHEAEQAVDHAWEVYHRAALGGTLASPAIQARIEQHLHEARSLVTQAQDAAEEGDEALVDRLLRQIGVHTAEAIEQSGEQKP